MKNYNIKLSHHEKRSLAWKIVLSMVVFLGLMILVGTVNQLVGTTSPFITYLIFITGLVGIGMFTVGYMIRDKIPSRMGIKCKRFPYMKKEFGIWHWTRGQIYLADILLVSASAALLGWCLSNTIPLLLIGTSLTSYVYFLHVPIFYVQFYLEIIIETMIMVFMLVGLVIELKVWILGKSGDFCYFEGFTAGSNLSPAECDINDPSCHLNENFK